MSKSKKEAINYEIKQSTYVNFKACNANEVSGDRLY